MTLARFPASLRLGSHVHERACLTVLLEGVMAERIRGRERYCEHASMLIKPPLERHDDLFGRHGSAQVIIEPTESELDLFTPYQSLFSTDRLLRDERAEHLARRLAAELERPDAFSLLAAAALTYELAVLAARRHQRRRYAVHPPAWLRRTHDWLQANVNGVPTLAAMAREAGVHPASLARSFRRHYGCSIGEFVRQRRIQLAARDLVTGDVTIAAIATAHGFTDQSHFTRQFRRHFGTTPHEYRERVRSR